MLKNQDSCWESYLSDFNLEIKEENRLILSEKINNNLFRNKIYSYKKDKENSQREFKEKKIIKEDYYHKIISPKGNNFSVSFNLFLEIQKE